MNTAQYYSRWYLKLIRNLLNHCRVIVYIVLVLSCLFIFNGRPKFIFRSSLHVPWLTDVHHIQAVKCLSVADQPDWPRPIQSNDGNIKETNYLTVVIVTARPEFKRLPATLAALVCHLDPRYLAEVMFLVPPRDVNILEPFLSIQQAKYWPWAISIISDDILLNHIHTNSYRLQMMFKLFLAQIIKTEYYLILDSDCVALWPIHAEQLLYQSKEIDNQNQNISLYKATYQAEGKSGHEKWWSESEQLLQIKLEACDNSSSSTMGVTPSILSKTIALTTLCRLQKLYGKGKFLNKMANWALWRLISGRMWTEYTLYYLTARCTRIFDRYHASISPSNSSPPLNLYGLSIWSHVDWTAEKQNELIELINVGLKWRRKEMEQSNGQAIIDTSMKTHSLFTILQGRHNVNPILYHQSFYPLFINYLKQQNQTENLVKILDNMAEILTKE